MKNLHSWGFGPFFQQQLSSQDASATPARVTAEHRGLYEIWSTAGAHQAQLAGRLRLELLDADLPCVGDWVILKERPSPGGVALIDGVLARRTVMTRGAAGRTARVQTIAANIDVVFAVCGLDADFNVRRIERYIALISASGAEPRVILNKADLCDLADARAAEVQARCPGVSTVVTSAIHREGLAAIRESIGAGQTAALVGSSGAGKSTLVNALLGEDRMATGEVRSSDGRGCHVTTHRQLVLLPGGGLLLDTPGMRELQLTDENGVEAAFDDIATLAEMCRFRDCRHTTEPGCAVKSAVESGELAQERWANFQKLEREAQAYTRRHDVRLQRASERKWGQLHKEAEQLRKWKGGKP